MFALAGRSSRAEKLFETYNIKKYTYAYSTDKYTYNEASDFCYANGYVLVPYLSIEHLGTQRRVWPHARAKEAIVKHEP